MRLNKKLAGYARLFMCVVLVFGAASTSYGLSKEEKLKRKLEALKRKKQELNQDMQQKLEQEVQADQDYSEVIAKYENIAQGCDQKKNTRCARVLITLGKLYYKKAKSDFIEAQKEFSKAMDEWERTQQGPRPQNPKPDYSKAFEMYNRVLEEYPDYEKGDEAAYQIGHISLLSGQFDRAAEAYEELVKEWPQSPRASYAHFHLADYYYNQRDYPKAIKHLEKVEEKDVNIEVWEMTHYRKAEMYYNQAAFDKAIDLFFTYIEKCNSGEYIKKEFIGEAKEFLAISFSDIPNGPERAVKFFKKVGHRPYEAYVMYTIGFKNRKHGQYDKAIEAFHTALEKYPYYREAPIARQKLIECYMIQKKPEKANEQRKILVDNYKSGTEWYEKNSNEKAVIDRSREHVKSALYNMGVYYHSMAQKEKKRSLYKKALERYHDYMERFPEEKWQNYEFTYYSAEIYHTLKQYEKAADYFWEVAMAEISTFPEYKAKVDSFAYQDAVEYEKKKQKKQKKGPNVIPQKDAGYNAIVALNTQRKKIKADKKLDDKEAYELPVTQKMLSLIEKYREKFPESEHVSKVVYTAGNINYLAQRYEEAINNFQAIVDHYKKADVFIDAYKMLAKAFVKLGNYELAIQRYDSLMAVMEKGQSDYQNIAELAASAMYAKADEMKKNRNYIGAADVFKTIYSKYPQTKVAINAWFDAGAAYEEAESWQKAAETFAKMSVNFSKKRMKTVKLLESSFIRAAENYKKIEAYEKAAQVYIEAADTIPTADYAIPSLSHAAESFQKAEKPRKAGEVFEMVYKRYGEDPRTPQALYNAGLVYEKADAYNKAIHVYKILAGKYPESEWASEGAYSIGLCYEKMEEYENAAAAYIKFAENFDNKAKQTHALVQAGDAYFKLDNLEAARENYLGAVTLYEKFTRKADYDKTIIAKAYFRIGEILQKRYNDIALTGRSERAVEQKVEEKVEALSKVGEKYTKAIKTGIREWVMRSTYRIGESFVQMANAMENQTLFGNESEKVAGKIKILMQLDKYYQKAIEQFQWNIKKAHEDNFTSDIVKQSKDMLMKCAFERAKLFERVGQTFANAPIPREFNKEERRIYQEQLQDKNLQAVQQSIPKYEEAVRVAKQLGIAENEWLDSTQARLENIAPTSEFVEVDIEKWTPEIDSAQQAAAQDSAAIADSVAAEERIISIDKKPVEKEDQTGKPWWQFWMLWK